MAEVATADRPGKVGMPPVAKRRAAGLDGIAAPGPLEPLRPDAADRHPLEPFIAGFLEVKLGRSDRPAHERPGIDVDQAHFLDALELEPECAAVVAVGFLTHFRNPGVASDVEPHGRAGLARRGLHRAPSPRE